MLRNEVRYTNAAAAMPGNLNLKTGELGPPSMFGAGEYAKDGLITVTEYLGRTPWYSRMVDMVADAMDGAPVESRFGELPASDSELNGDYLQVLARLAQHDRRPAFRRLGATHRRRLHRGSPPGQPRRAERQMGLRRAHRRPAAAPPRPRQRADRRPRPAVRQRAALEDAARRKVAAGDRAHARSRARLRESGRHALQRGRHRDAEAVGRRPVGQLGLRATARSTRSTMHGRHALSRRRRAVLRNLPKYRRYVVGAAPERSRSCRSDRSTATPTPSRARSTWSRASRCRKRSTGSSRRCR